ncbi:PEP-CTERM sorting domain-containing protein [Rhizobacter sp. Root404]|jgi:hypothetical protein|uniref:PEP-CTERM sorting domain-containing protein n=1 Tax=Rhizobacter sp. Root404 TaxID=1736528 RepID=UPI0009EAF94F|nr:PEP-CTERM sorting domain-containing protein [Rhizobacter sp. Root404]
MSFSYHLRAAAATALLGLAGSAYADLPPVVAPCSVTDITINAIDCRGFYSSQYLSGNPGDVAVQIEALGQLGFTWDGVTTVTADNQSGLGGVTTLNFATPLVGLTYIGIHYGGGTNSPTPNAGDTTVFYSLDAGAGITSLQLAYGSSSDVKVYSTMPAVPEPETYALMLAGLGVVGFMARRRKQQA